VGARRLISVFTLHLIPSSKPADWESSRQDAVESIASRATNGFRPRKFSHPKNALEIGTRIMIFLEQKSSCGAQDE
jgi:hypothetical protein